MRHPDAKGKGGANLGCIVAVGGALVGFIVGGIVGANWTPV